MSDQSKYNPQVRCQAQNASGGQCGQGIYGIDCQPFCYSHHPTTQAEVASGRAAAGDRRDAARAARKEAAVRASSDRREPSTPASEVRPEDLANTAGVRAFLVRVTCDLAANRISPRVADQYVKLAAGILKAEDRGLADRLAKIEKALAQQSTPNSFVKRRK